MGWVKILRLKELIMSVISALFFGFLLMMFGGLFVFIISVASASKQRPTNAEVFVGFLGPIVAIIGFAGLLTTIGEHVVAASVVEDDPAPVAFKQLTSADAPNIDFGLPPRKWVTISNSGDIDTGDLSCDDALRLVVESYMTHMDADIR